MKTLLALLFVAVFSTASNCGSTQLPDAAPAPVAPSCATACARAAALGCDYAQPSPDGVTCEAVCKNAQGLFRWDLACRTGISACADVLGCQ